MSAEQRTRAALEWAIPETVIRLPPDLQCVSGWSWDADDVSLFGFSGDGSYRFHVAAERRGARKIRIAVMRVKGGDGKVKWTSPMPEPLPPARANVDEVQG